MKFSSDHPHRCVLAQGRRLLTRWVMLGALLGASAAGSLLAASATAYATDYATAPSGSAYGQFATWAAQYGAANASARQQLAATGLSLAQQRRAALTALIRSNPQQALALAVPASVRAQLPSDVVAQLETRVSGLGDLSVLAALAARGGAAVEPVWREVRLGGTSYRAYVYGRRSAETSKAGIPLSGIVIDGVLALSESALRPLESGEIADPALPVVDLSGGAQSPVVAEVGGKIYKFASDVQLQQAEAQLDAAETGLAPQPARSATSILEPSTSSNSNAGVNPTAWTTGAKKILVIRVDFSDLTGDPAFPGLTTDTAAYCQSLMDGKVSPYYIKSSYGLTSMSNTVSSTLYRMPQTASYYATGGLNTQLHTDAETLASADFNLTNFDRIVVVFSFLGNLSGSQITYGGLAMVSGPSVWVNGEFDFRVVAHELGHTYGLYHAGLWQVTDGNPISPNASVIEYGDDFDTMGANYADDQAVDFGPYNKNSLGWIPDAKIKAITTNGVYRIYAFDWANSANATNHPTLGLTYVKDSSRTYYIGDRANFTGNPYMSSGAYVIWVFDTVGAGSGGGFKSTLLDMNTPGYSVSPGVNSDFDAALLVGQTFSDPDSGLLITPIRQGGTFPDTWLDLRVGPDQQPNLVVLTNLVSGGNGNSVIDYDECVNFFITLTNKGGYGATNIQAVLSTATPGAFIAQPASAYPDLAAGASGNNVTAFKISTTPDFIVGTPIRLFLALKSDQSSTTLRFTVPTGQAGVPMRFDGPAPMDLPQSNQISSAVLVSNQTYAVQKVTVSVYFADMLYNYGLLLRLVSPDGTTNVLYDNTSSVGQNLGAACAPEGYRTTFDDAAATSINNGVSPYLGSFQPQSPLSVYIGKYGNNANGVWRLEAVDQYGWAYGTLECWSLFITPTLGSDGGGECPGADLALGMTSAPNPIIIGNYLTYSISVTNKGPSTAKNVTVSQLLPSSVAFGSAMPSQGGYSLAGNILTFNLGGMAPKAVATMTVSVLPITVGTISSTATASSEQSDPDLSNNSASVNTLVNPAQTDMAVGLTVAPIATTLGSPLTYTVSVTNNGPLGAPGVVANNYFPSSVVIQSVSVSQGTASIASGQVTCNFGYVNLSGRATATILAQPTAQGTLVVTSTVASSLIDPVPANNRSTVAAVIAPAADLILSLSSLPNPVVTQSNLTYTVVVSNAGPSIATSVGVTANLDPSLTNYVLTASQGTITNLGPVITATLGTLNVGASATNTITVKTPLTPSNLVITANAAVAGAETDPYPADNSATITTTVAPPFVNIVPVSARITSENLVTNGAVDNGERVTVALYLENLGNAPSASVVATLLTNSGVTPYAPNTPQTYGVLQPSPNPTITNRPFTFTASGANGATINAVLRLTTNGVFLTNVSFAFTLPNTVTIPGGGAIAIQDDTSALPYPSTINVSGLSGVVGQVTLTLSNLTHGFVADVDALLVSPAGPSTMLMSGAGLPYAVDNATVTFDDSAATPIPAPNSDQLILSGSYQPADYLPTTNLPAPAPQGPYTTAMAVFNGANPNGTWALYVDDHTFGESGAISGWSLAVTMITPVNATADLALSGLAMPPSVTAGSLLTNTFLVTNQGPNAVSSAVFTEVLPGNVTLVSSKTSQGTLSLVGGTLTGNLGALGTGAMATVTVVVVPGAGAAGWLTNTASVVAASGETDLNLANNTASVAAQVNLPSADLALTLAPVTNVVTIGSNVVFYLTVTNQGPGLALSSGVTNQLPAGVTYVSASSTWGSWSNLGQQVYFNLGDLSSNAGAALTITGRAVQLGSLTNVAAAYSSSVDPVPTNNSAATAVTIVNPVPSIQPAAAALLAESGPVNGAIDPGETVTVRFTLTNSGAVATSPGFSAALLATGGVNGPSAARTYGVLTPGGPAASQAFSFTASGVAGGTILATLQLTDGVTNLGTATFTFTLSSKSAFANSAAITIPDHGAAGPYPSIIVVSGVTGVVSKVTATLNGFTHTFPSDVNVLLASPSGSNVVLMAHLGGGSSVSNLTLVFDDAATTVLPSNTTMTSGTNRPAQFGAAILGPPAPAYPYGTTLSGLNWSSPNGEWALYVYDTSKGDAGSILRGWSLNLTTVTPLNPPTDLGVGIAAAPASLLLNQLATNVISVTNFGPSAATGVMVTNMLPAGATYQFSIPSVTISSAGSNYLVLNLGSLAAGVTTNVSIVTTLGQIGVATNLARVVADQEDLNAANNSAQSTATVSSGSIAVAGSVKKGNFQLSASAMPGSTYVVQCATNLSIKPIVWLPLSTNTAGADGVISFTDSNAASHKLRFYRLSLQP